MVRKKYWFEDKEAFESEKSIRKFILENANSVRFTSVEWMEGKEGKHSSIPTINAAFKTSNVSSDLIDPWTKWVDKKSIKHRGGNKDERFVKILKYLKKDFIKNFKNNKGYEEKPLKGDKLNHYLYKLSKHIGDLFNKETLIFSHYNPKSKFYGFDDPIFYKKGEMIAGVISHHPIIYLYLTPALKEKFEKTEKLSLKKYRL